MKSPGRGGSRPTPGLSKDALRIRRPKVTDLFENEAVFLCTHDLEGALLTINDSSCRALGYAADELVGRSIRDVLAPDYRGEFDGYLARLRGSGAATGVMTVVTRAGDKRYWHYQNVLRREGAAGDIAHGTAIDVTGLIHEERGALEALRKRTAYLTALLEQSPLAILVHDADDLVQFANPAFERLFQYAESEVIGRHVFDLLAPGENTVDPVADRLKAGASVRETGRRRRKDGTILDVELDAFPLFDGGAVAGAFRIYHDISERKKADGALRAAEERYRLLFERNLAGMYRSMPDGTLLDCNEAFANILGYSSREEILSKNARSLYFYEADREAIVDEVAAAGSVSGREVCLRRRDGTPAWVLDNMSFVPGTGGSPALLEGSIIDIGDRRNAEDALRISEERYRFLFDRNPLPMWVYDADTLRFLDVNEAAIAHYGYSREEFLSMRLPDIWPPGDRGRHPIAPSAARPQPFSPSRHVLKDGRIADVEISAVDLPGGYVRRRMALSRDVTEQKAAERALVESERKYRHIFDLAPVGIYQITPEGRILTVNPAFASMLGYESPEELVSGHTAQDLYFQPEDREEAIREFANSRLPRATIDRRLKSRAGDAVWLQITAQTFLDESSNVEYFEGFTYDITEKKRVEEQQARLQQAVLETARQWRDTFDAIETPVLVADGNALVKRLNRAAVELTGRTYVDVLGRALDAIADGEVWKTAAALVRDPRPDRSRSGVLCRDEEAQKVWEISVSGYPSPDAKGPPMSIVVLRDITATVKLQESVMRAESMSSMGSLVAGVAHEVRNPLFAISATLDAFDARFRERDDYKKYAQALRTQLDRMNHLMRDLLDYGRPAVLELREVPPAELVRDAVRGCADLATRCSTPVEADAPEDLPLIRVDRGRTVQVFINLIENAIQHSPERQPVSVRAEALPRDDSAGVRFTVEDRGPGFQSADLPKLFDPFFTKRQGGTGLGLAIVRRIVEEHGGTIHPTNRPDGGASISVWLPCEPPGAGENERKA